MQKEPHNALTRDDEQGKRDRTRIGRRECDRDGWIFGIFHATELPPVVPRTPDGPARPRTAPIVVLLLK